MNRSALTLPPADSDLFADELLHRVRRPRSTAAPLPIRVDGSALSRAGHAALRSIETEAAYWERDRQLHDAVVAEVEMGLAA